MLRKLTYIVCICLSVIRVQAQCPAVSVLASDSLYCYSDFLEFELTGLAPGYTVEWNLGSGYDTATTIYTTTVGASGMIDVFVRFVLADGTVCNHVEYDVTRVIAALQPEYKASRSVLCNGPDTITLFDITNNSVSRNWIVNGNPISNAAQAQSIYISQSGQTDLTMVVKDQYGCTKVQVFEDSVEVFDNIGLSISKSNTTDFCIPYTSNFTSSFTTTQTIDSFRWDFQGSTTPKVYTQNASGVVYNNTGQFQVDFSVFTNKGCVYTANENKFVQLGDTVSLNVVSTQSDVCVSEEVKFTETVQPLPGKLTWNVAANSIKNIGKYEILTTFRDTGYFDLELVHDHLGCISTLQIDSFIRVKGVKGNFKTSASIHCDTPFTVNFINLTDSTLNISSYLWRLAYSGNDSVFYTNNNRHMSYTFDSMGALYTVDLITMDAQGCSDTFTAINKIKLQTYQFNISELRPPVACVGQNVRIINRTAKGSDLGTDSYLWTYYDLDNVTVLGTSGSQHGIRQYSDTGFYSFKLKMSNSLGCSDSISIYDTIEIIDPEIDYVLSDSSICLGDSILCQGLSIPAYADFSYKWRFQHDSSAYTLLVEGDSIYAPLSEIGSYTLTMVMSLAGGCKDSISRKVYVNGVLGTIILDSASGCSPLTVRPQYQIYQNINAGGTDSVIYYDWFINPLDGVTVNGINAANPEIIIDGFGSYEISVFLTNSSGCGNYSAQSSDVQIGVKAKYRTGGNNFDACMGKDIVLRDFTSNSPDFYEWSTNPPVPFTLDTLDASQLRYTLVFYDTGTFDLKLVAGKNGQCYDTFVRSFHVVTMVPDFEILDTVLYCAPQTTGMYSTSFNADSVWYLFSDGMQVFAATDTVYHSFPENGFQIVSVIASNTEGCRDTFTQDSVLFIQGPAAGFNLQPLSGCAPLVIDFENSSEFSDKVVLYFGDGSKDSTWPVTHTYTLDSGNLSQDFVPSVIAIDNNGCFDTLILDTFIRVFQNPITSALIGPDTILCQNSKLYFESTGLNADSANWFLNGVLISTAKSDSLISTQNGINELKLVVYTAQACSDSASYFFNTLAVPGLLLDYDSLACPNQTFVAKATVNGLASVDNYQWNFGELGNPMNIQTTTADNAGIDYTIPGIKKVKVKVNYLNGCFSNDSFYTRVYDPSSMVPLDLDYVSVNGSGTIDLFHAGTSFSKAVTYNYYRNDSLIARESDLGARTYSDNKALLIPGNYCYYITLTDVCGYETAKGTEHCPVVLDAYSIVHKQNELTWSPYVGWTNIQGYEIYRNLNGGTYTLLAQVPSGQSTYVDSPLCPGLFGYRIHVIHGSANWISRSNTDTEVPRYISNQIIPHIRVVTVTETDEIEVFWPASLYAGFDHYEIDKYENSIGTPVQTFVTNQTYLLDPNVSTADISYIYEIREYDDCDSMSGPGRYGKSIVLTGTRLQSSTNLSWTAYEDWQSGVDYYEVLVKENGLYTVIASLPGNQLNFNDQGVHVEDAQGRYIYRIRAIGVDNDTSYSNLIFITGGPIVFIPNAFSPNHDGINDVFSISTVFVKNSSEIKPEDFKIEIYNRWGELMYSSTDRDFEWDGTYNGVDVQQGVYFYIIKFTESKGFKSYGKGTITLLR